MSIINAHPRSKQPSTMNYALKAALSLICVLLLGSCSILESLYENSPQLVFWWLDSYVDFKDAQVSNVKEELKALQKWHRETQLPQMLLWTQDLIPLAALDLSPEQTCGLEQKALQTVPEVMERLSPSIAKIATTLSAEQLKNIQSTFEKKDKEWRKEWMSGSLEDQLEHQTEKGLEQARDLYGRISNAQKLELRDLAQHSGFEPSKSLAIKRYRQEETLKALEKIRLLKQRGDLTTEAQTKAAELVVRDWLNGSFRPKDPELLQYSEHRLRVNCEAVASFHNKTTAEQRSKARKKLVFYESVIAKLMQIR